MPRETKKQASYRLPPSLQAELKTAAELADISISVYVEQAIRREIERDRKRASA